MSRVGRPPKIRHDDRVKIREQWARGRNPPPLTVKQLAYDWGVSMMTVRRIIEYDELEMEQRRQKEQE